MNKTLIAGAIALSLGTVATSAQAFEIDMTEMVFGVVSSASGTIDRTSLGDTFTGTFFSAPWAATTLTFYSEGSGANIWAGTSLHGAYSYNFTLTGTQFAYGVSWDWGVNYDIPVLMIMDCGSVTPAPGDSCTGIGTPMQIGPLAGQYPAFNGVVASNAAPVFTSANTVSVDEHHIITGYTAIAQYNVGDVFTYSLTGGADQSVFTIDSNTGVLSFKSKPDFEVPADSDGNNNYEVIVTADDGAGNTLTQTVVITVNNVLSEVLYFNDNITTDAVSYAENAVSAVYDVDAFSPNPAITYSLASSDATSFNIDANTGVVTFVVPPDFETKTPYLISIIASDGVEQDISFYLIVHIQDVNDIAPEFTSSNTITVVENSSYPDNIFYTAVTTDADTTADTVTFSMSGADSDKLGIEPSTGEVYFYSYTMPDFDVPGDADGDNVYEITITADDGISTTDLLFTINVTNINEAPVITLNSPSTIYNLLIGDTYVDAGAIATDPEDGDLASSMVVTNTVDISTTGNYTVTYQVTDSNGVTVTASRKVSVRANVLKIDMTEMYFPDAAALSGQISSASIYDTFEGIFFSQPFIVTTLAFYPEGSGAQTWADDDCQGAFAYYFNLTGSQLAFATHFDWGMSCGIPTLVIMDCGSFDPAPGAICTGIGTPMQTPPFPGQAPAFNGVVAQPVGNVPDITLNGDSAIFLEVDSIYNDSGASATDIEDGDLTSSIVSNNPVDTSVDGVYTVIYRVTDSDANNAYARRTVGIGDADGDGLSFSNDNCLAVTNSNQRDTDGDGFGNYCDTDFNNDGVVNSLDIGIFKQRFFTTDVDSDVNGDGATNSLDLGLFKKMYIKPPGPSGLVL